MPHCILHPPGSTSSPETDFVTFRICPVQTVSVCTSLLGLFLLHTSPLRLFLYPRQTPPGLCWFPLQSLIISYTLDAGYHIEENTLAVQFNLYSQARSAEVLAVVENKNRKINKKDPTQEHTLVY